MVIARFARPLAAFSSVVLAACAGGGGPPHPAGWSQAQGDAWTHGLAVYRTRTIPFSGTLKELASRETIDAVLRSPGLHLLKIVPYPDCPGLGGLMSFAGAPSSPRAAQNGPAAAERGDRTMLEGFVIRDAQATLVTYLRPAGTAADADAMNAMRATICHETI